MSDLPNGGMREPWERERLKPWLAWYREVFTYQLRHPERPVARFATEFIGSVGPNHYRVEPYRNLFQNVAMVATARRMVREIQGALAGASERA